MPDKTTIMDAREKLNEFADLRGWDKNKLIGWSECADFADWFLGEMSPEHKYRLNILKFANRWGLEFDEEGEVGFGRKCVGLRSGDKYVDYNPSDRVTYDYIDRYFDQRLYDAAPENAYHKHNCLAVLGRGEPALRELSEWVDALNKLDVSVVRYNTGATGLQALMQGVDGVTLVIN